MSIFSKSNSSPVAICTLSDSELCDYLWKLQDVHKSEVVVRICRGTRMRTTQKCFDEVSAAFQFPYYFSSNWNSFDECISDLSWLEADYYALCIADSEEMFADENASQFLDFIERLQRIAEGWAGGNPNLEVFGRSAALFRVLIQLKSGDKSGLLKKLIALGVKADFLSAQLKT